MIAEPEFRRCGLARESLSLIIAYAHATLALPYDRFFARIGYDNAASLKLFKSLRFIEHKRVDVFREVELRLRDHFVEPPSMQRAEWPLPSP